MLDAVVHEDFDDALAFRGLHVQDDLAAERGVDAAAVHEEGAVEEAGVREGDDREWVGWVIGVGGLREDGVLAPVEVDAAEPGALGREDGEGGRGLVEGVAGCCLVEGLGAGVDGGELVEAGRVQNQVPGEGIAGAGAGEDAAGLGGGLAGGQGWGLGGEVEGFGVLAGAEDPESGHGEEGEDGPASAGEGGLAFADLGVDEAEEPGASERQEQQQKQDGLEDEDEGAGVPSRVEREEGAQAVVVGPVQEEVREEGKEGEEIKLGPANGGMGQLGLRAAGADAVQGVESGGDEGGFERDAEESVGDAAMMLEAYEGAAQRPEGVDVRELGGDDHGGGGIGCATVEAGARENRAGEDVSDWLHGFEDTCKRGSCRTGPLRVEGTSCRVIRSRSSDASRAFRWSARASVCDQWEHPREAQHGTKCLFILAGWRRG
jgi:hypothetical protein